MTTIRKARPDDAEGILALMNPFTRNGILLDRTREEILSTIDNFLVAADETDSIAGTVSFYDYGEMLKEIRSLAVAQEKQGRGTGAELVKGLVADLRRTSPEAKIFALTLVPDFFVKMGFSVVDKNTLPEKIWKDCSKCRKRDHCDEVAVTMGKGGERGNTV